MSNWSNWSQFAAMGGYGFYVWGSFGMCVLVLVVEVALLGARRRALKADAEDTSAGFGKSGA